ncbi:hypothetical protein AGOR_G00184400 [Albula goreensis]|uniref:Shootin-1 n=1 Tax=Albula goreensis TaxID=1534307 RepID=A0A8T3CXB8_9TELE|nr:hypothetical protein AGOR_G00184400 [Albula goreensis]
MSWTVAPQLLRTSSITWTPESTEGSSCSSEDEEDIECQILEKERDEANQKLSEIEEVSTQLLKEINALEMQFQIERACRESAEAFAMKMTKENKVLKRKSQALMPLIPELPENFDALNLNLEDDPESEKDTDSSAESILQWQAQIKDLQSSLDQLIGEKMQLSNQVEALKREQAELKEQLLEETEEKEALLRKLNKQNRTMNKVKRVSQLVSQEFNDITQRLQLEQGLRQHAEAFAHQMLLKQRESQRQSVMLLQSTEKTPQLQQALQQVAHISNTLEEIRLQQQNQVLQAQSSLEGMEVLSELHSVRAQLEASETQRTEMETQLSNAQHTISQLHQEVKDLQDRLKLMAEVPPTQKDPPQEESATPAPPPPPPPPLPPPPTSPAAVDPLEALKKRKKMGTANTKPSQDQPNSQNMKARAVEEMMERIKKGIVLRPTQRPVQVGSEDDSAWKDQKSDKRKSAVLELQGMLDSMKQPTRRRGMSRKRISRNVGEVELQAVLLRRRRAMGDEQDRPTSMKPQDPEPSRSPNGTLLWAGESSNTPVMRRLKQNREKRNSQVRASEHVIWEDS